MGEPVATRKHVVSRIIAMGAHASRLGLRILRAVVVTLHMRNLWTLSN